MLAQPQVTRRDVMACCAPFLVRLILQDAVLVISLYPARHLVLVVGIVPVYCVTIV